MQVMPPDKSFCEKNIARGTTDPGYWVYNLNHVSDWDQFEIILAEKDYSSYGLNTLGPLCLGQCLKDFLHFSFKFFKTFFWNFFGTFFNFFSDIFQSDLYFISMNNNRIYSKGLVRWHHMHQFLFWPPGGATWIGCQCGHQMALLILVVDLANNRIYLNVATRWHYLY